MAKIKTSPDAIKLLLKYCGHEAFQKKKKNTNKLCIWCKSSPVTGTCRTETWHPHNKQRWTSTRWLPHQIDNHNNQFRNYSFKIYVTKLKNNMKKKQKKKNAPCPDKFIFNQKTKQQKLASSDDKNSWYVIPDYSLRVHSLWTYGWLSSVNLYMAVAFQVAMVTWHTGAKQTWIKDK